jgi:hypothetical protein
LVLLTGQIGLIRYVKALFVKENGIKDSL